MKQKVLGATLVLGAPVNSLASYSSKNDGKVDLSKIENVDALTNLEISYADNEKAKLCDLDDKATKRKFSCDKEAFKKGNYSFTLSLPATKQTKAENGVVIAVCKISTDNEGKDLKLDTLSEFKNLDPGSYVIFSSADSKASIKGEEKVFTEKQKLNSANNGFEKNEDKK